MFISREGREAEIGQRVRVYRNLHNDMFSIQSPKTNLVIGYSKSIELSDARYVVRKKGQEKVRKEKRKNVHAYVEGTLLSFEPKESDLKAGYYNPYKTDTFVTENGEPLYGSEISVCENGKIFYKNK